ncbi:MAG: uroporphyrinogen-III C-methyltransferase [Brumimicrobium sp.]|nr:uroporphyrinogen-III C-methyltransferase [Brumimicrobium sp.]
MKKIGKLTLVGAGPGDPELITLKGLRAIQQADVILYDALIDDSLLKYASGSKKIFVGKRKNYHRYSQDDINGLIVHYAIQGNYVVRLKGGDPFVFGRGSEEIAYAESFGIETEIVSGVSSSIAVPASAGIALTQRNISESFWVITGTTRSGKISDDIRLAARSTATVVILMGMSKLHEITAEFRKNGRAELPVAVIQNGCTPREKIGIGTVDSIVDVVAELNLSSPAVIVIGEVVRSSALTETVRKWQIHESFKDLSYA